MRLTPEQLNILKAIDKDRGAVFNNIQQFLDYSIEFIRYNLKLLKDNNFVGFNQSFEGIDDIWLTDKGKVAIENPDYLIQQDNLPMSYINISGSNNIGGIVQNSNDTIVNFNQTINQNTTEIINSINSLYESVTNFPEDEREMATIHLDNLKEEIEKPERKNPNKIKAYFGAFLGIALPLLGCVANTTDFVNNITDLADKFNFKIELIKLDSMTQRNQFNQEQIDALADEIDRAVWKNLKPKFIK